MGFESLQARRSIQPQFSLLTCGFLFSRAASASDPTPGGPRLPYSLGVISKWRLASALLMVAVVAAVGAVVVHARTSAPEPSDASVHQLGESECNAGGHSWTISGCLTQEEARREQARRAQYSREAEAARAQVKERTRLEKQGWTSFDEGIGAEGLFYRPMTEAQVEALADTRCTNTPCLVMLVHSDSATDCSRGLTVRFNLLSKGTIIGTEGARIGSLPPGSRARLVVPLLTGVDRGAHAEFTRLTCA